MIDFNSGLVLHFYPLSQLEIAVFPKVDQNHKPSLTKNGQNEGPRQGKPRTICSYRGLLNK